MLKELKREIEQIAGPLLESKNIDLVEVQAKRINRQIIVDVLADKPSGGITIDECASLNKDLNERIEGLSLIEDSYVINVSSPGIDRPLKTEKDFKRVLGRDVRFHLAEKVEEKLEHSGRVKDAANGKVIIDTANGELGINLENIKKAIQII